MKYLILAVFIFVLVFYFNIGCKENSAPIQPHISTPFILKGEVVGDGNVLPTSGIISAKVTITNGVQTQSVLTDSFGYFQFNNISSGLYSVNVEKDLLYNNKLVLDTSLTVSTSDSINTLVINDISYDYFPLKVGNSWKWTGSSYGALIGLGGPVWNDSFTVEIQITDKQEINDVNLYHFIGQKIYIHGNYLSTWGSTDTIKLDGITEQVEGNFKDNNGKIHAEFISDGSIPNLDMISFERYLLWGGFHAVLDSSFLNDIFNNPYGNVTITEDSLELLVHIPFEDRIFAPNIGIQSYSIVEYGNDPDGADYKLTEYNIVR